MSTTERVNKVIANELNVKPESIRPTDMYGINLGADSLDFIQLVMSFEEEFGIEIKDEDAEPLWSKPISETVAHIESHLTAKLGR